MFNCDIQILLKSYTIIVQKRRENINTLSRPNFSLKFSLSKPDLDDFENLDHFKFVFYLLQQKLMAN